MSKRIFPGLLLSICVGSFSVVQGLGQALPRDRNKEIIYQVFTDRFYDGDPTNNDPPQSRGLYNPPDSDPLNPFLYMGGDFEGIRQKLGYLKEMGVTVIQIQPPVDNINVSIPTPRGKMGAGYHAYWARDFMRPEEHFGDEANSWKAFDAMVQEAHALGLGVYIDYAPNHTSPRNVGEFGALWDNGRFVADYLEETLNRPKCNDPNPYPTPNSECFFNHGPTVSEDEDWIDHYRSVYWPIFSLNDLRSENPIVDEYLRSAAVQLQAHGVDGFRVDASKHLTWDWNDVLANTIYTNGSSFVFGEWVTSINGPLYRDYVKVAKKSSTSQEDFPLFFEIEDAFKDRGRGFYGVNDVIEETKKDFGWPRYNDLVLFLEYHDVQRLQTFYRLDPDRGRKVQHLVISFLLTCRGIPRIYYGTEQYLHDDTCQPTEDMKDPEACGGNPYNRPMMTDWNPTTTAYQLIKKLSDLRELNPAIPYGSMRQRWVNNDVYCYERQFPPYDPVNSNRPNDIVLVCMNKSHSNSHLIAGLRTVLPVESASGASLYNDYLGKEFGGLDITVRRDDNPNRNAVDPFDLPPLAMAIWHKQGDVPGPHVGSINPYAGQADILVTVGGTGFGTVPGTVLVGKTPATIQSWRDSQVTFTVPSISPGEYRVQLEDSTGRPAEDMFPFTVLTGSLVNVIFRVNNPPPVSPNESIFLIGNVVELGNWSTAYEKAAGPMLRPLPTDQDFFYTVAVPAGAPIEYKYVKVITNDGTVVKIESGPNHTYTVPKSGVGAVTVDWQYESFGWTGAAQRP